MFLNGWSLMLVISEPHCEVSCKLFPARNRFCVSTLLFIQFLNICYDLFCLIAAASSTASNLATCQGYVATLHSLAASCFIVILVWWSPTSSTAPMQCQHLYFPVCRFCLPHWRTLNISPPIHQSQCHLRGSQLSPSTVRLSNSSSLLSALSIWHCLNELWILQHMSKGWEHISVWLLLFRVPERFHTDDLRQQHSIVQKPKIHY
jgi:hypothetical protein